jgi:tRNA-splicing ligase RtcB
MQRVTDKFLNWASILDHEALMQAARASRMPFIYPHLALMADAHPGKGATVGSVIPTLGAIIPAAVGVDIGCGMIAFRTQFFDWEVFARASVKGMDKLRESIERAIPSSMGRYNQEITATARPRINELYATLGVNQANDVAPTWPDQLGTLGSGNHFIEVTVDEERRVWLFLHSGSRGVGNKLAMRHIKAAQEYTVPGHGKPAKYKLEHIDLAYLEEGTPQFSEYIEALTWAQRFAFLNREEMMDRLVRCFERWMDSAVLVQEKVNCHHNYTLKETHYGRTVWLSRKGAINASYGVPGLIPGSMGDASYVVVGKGNKESLNSAPHGAGRVYSRGQAKRAFDLDDLERKMEGIEWRHDAAFLDEHPNAYKPIDQVMADAAELVEIKHTLHQIVNVKGV